nr:phosphopantothenoylcysteine decarboxylase subunit VHS3-like [Aegilops tauschii subsp. strangulata]
MAQLELIKAEEEDAAAEAYDEIVAHYRRKRADCKARIVNELGEEAYLKLEAGDDCVAKDPDYVDEINERAILPGYKKLSDTDLYLEIYSCLHPDSESDSEENDDGHNDDGDDDDDDDGGGDEDEEAEEDSDSKEEEGEEEEGEEELEAEKFISLAESRVAAAEAALGEFEWRTGPVTLSWRSEGKSCSWSTWTT